MKSKISNLCLLSSESHHYQQSLRLNMCPNVAYRFDEIMLLNRSGSGMNLVAPENLASRKEKCLTFGEAEAIVVFDTCPNGNDPTYAWLVLQALDDSGDVIIQHESSGKFISERNQVVVLTRESHPWSLVYHDSQNSKYCIELICI